MPGRFERLAARLEPRASPPADLRRAVVAVVLRAPEEAPEVLLMRRVEHPADPWSGHISLPGGHAEEHDGTLYRAVVRETAEEVGVDLERCARRLGCLPFVQARNRHRVLPLTITPFVFAEEGGLAPVAGPEAQEVFWFPLARAWSGELDTSFAWEYDGRSVCMPAWDFEGRVVWGLTHRMLSVLRERYPMEEGGYGSGD